MQGFSKTGSLQWPSFVQPEPYRSLNHNMTANFAQATSAQEIISAYDAIDPSHADKLRSAIDAGKNPFVGESTGFKPTFIVRNSLGEVKGVASYYLTHDVDGKIDIAASIDTGLDKRSIITQPLAEMAKHYGSDLLEVVQGNMSATNNLKVDPTMFGKIPERAAPGSFATTNGHIRFPVGDVQADLPPLEPIKPRPSQNTPDIKPPSGDSGGKPAPQAAEGPKGFDTLAPFIDKPAPLSEAAKESLHTTFTEQAFNAARKDLGITGAHPTYADFKIQVNQPLYFVEQARNIARSNDADVSSLARGAETVDDVRFRLNNAAHIAQQSFDDGNRIAKHITDVALDRSVREGFPTPSTAERQAFAEKNKPTPLSIANMAYRLQQGTAAGTIQEINSAKTLSGGSGKAAAWLKKSAENLNTIARNVSSALLTRAGNAAQLPGAGLSVLAASASAAHNDVRQRLTTLANAYAERQHRYANPTPGDVGAMLLSGRGDVQRWLNSGSSDPAPMPSRTISRHIDDAVGRTAQIALSLRPAQNLRALKNFIQDRAIAAQSLLHTAYNKVNDGIQRVLISDTFNKFRSGAGKAALGLTVAGGLAHMIGPHSAMAADHIATLLHNGSLSPIQPSDVALGGHATHLAGPLLTSTAGQVEQLTKSAHDYMATHASPNLVSVANDQAMGDTLKAGLDHAQAQAAPRMAFSGGNDELAKAMHASDAHAMTGSATVTASVNEATEARARLAPDSTDVFVNEHFAHPSIDNAASHAAETVVAGVKEPMHTASMHTPDAPAHVSHAHHAKSPEVTVVGHRHLNAETLNAREQVAINAAKHDGHDFSALREFDAKKGTFENHSVEFASDKHPDAPAHNAPQASTPEQRVEDMSHRVDNLMKSGKFSLVVDPDSGQTNVVETSSLHQHGAKPGSVVFNQSIHADAQRLGMEGHDGSFLNDKDAHHFEKNSPMAHIQHEAAHGIAPTSLDLQAINDMSNYAKERNMALFVDGKGIAFTVDLEGHLTPNSEVVINTPKGLTGVSLSSFEHVKSLGADMTPAVRGESVHDVAANYGEITQGGGSAHVQVASPDGKTHDLTLSNGEVEHSAVHDPKRASFFERAGNFFDRNIVEPIKDQTKGVGREVGLDM